MNSALLMLLLFPGDGEGAVIVAGPFRAVSVQLVSPGAIKAQSFQPGADSVQLFTPGAEEVQGHN